MNIKSKMHIFIFCLICGLALPPIGYAQNGSDPFPVPEIISPNVAFWTQIYATYATNQGVVHDSNNLGIIYEVIPLEVYGTPGAGKINRKRIKRSTEKYRHILRSLAKNPDRADKEMRRVAALFGDTKERRVYQLAAARIRCQVGQKDRFRAGLIRSGAYLQQIRQILKSHGLPEDLGYLPHVESSFNPKAYSKFGAAGIWQFTRSTGKRFMEVGYAMDERRDPILATHAAARLLKENYQKLDSWPLAITAYNHGAAGMQRAKRAYGDYAAIFENYRSRIFKFASRNFYAEFLAARQVAANYRYYFGELNLDRPMPIHSFVLDSYIAFEDVSRHFEVEKTTLQNLNPALRTPVINGQKLIPKGYALRLPDKGSNLMAQLTDSLPKTLFHSSQKPSSFYTVQRNDTAGKIARMHGVKLKDLILANNLNHRATIYPHQTLRIPLPGEKAAPEATLVAAADKKANIRNAAGIPQTDPAPPPTETSEKPETQVYPKPVLASVIPLSQSDDEGSSAWTDFDPFSQQAIANSEVVMADVGFEKLYKHEGRTIGTIQVEIEETLGHYAEWAGVPTRQIRYLNNLRYGSVLRLHQKIKVPLHRTAAREFEQSRYEYHKRLQEDFFTVFKIANFLSYTISTGDNYWALCRQKFDIPLWLLKHYNPGVDLAELKPGQQIIIPEIAKTSPEDEATPALEADL